MGENCNLPFKNGQQIESKSFAQGYRGAWFRCTIEGMSFRKNQCGFSLEFFDFPDEKIRWTKLYQDPSIGKGNRDQRKLHLMVRPRFPCFNRESERMEENIVTEVVAIIRDTWKVGDLVDWWFDDCYWSGAISLLLEQDKVQVSLLEPPFGEGGIYEASAKDLRPSLDWSPEDGWTVPLPKDDVSYQSCVLSLSPPSQRNDPDHLHSEVGQVHDRREDLSSHGDGLVSVSSKEFISLPIAPENASKPDEILKQTLDHQSGVRIRNSNAKDMLSALDYGEAMADEKSRSTRDRYNVRGPSKRLKICEDEYQSPVLMTNTIESSVMALEKLINKINRLQDVLQFGPHGSMKPVWRFTENNESTRQK
ncbi:hypothetical protein AMTRI_Chr03g146760 [Amborella trichopoda]